MSKKLIFFVISFSLFAGPIFSRVQAAGPQGVITWKARTFVPSEYQGKTLPGSNTPVLASFEILDGGKLVNISGYKIYWYMNDHLIDRGVGLQTVTLRTPQVVGGGTITLRAQISDYPGGIFSKSVDIPLVSPSVVLESPYAGNRFTGQSAQLKALPYFFTVTDISFLSFSWKVNGGPVQTIENPQYLTVNINPGAAAGSLLDVAATVTNPAGYFESVTASKSLTLSQ